MAHCEQNNKITIVYKGKINSCTDTNLILTYKGNHEIIEHIRCEWDPWSMSQQKRGGLG